MCGATETRQSVANDTNTWHIKPAMRCTCGEPNESDRVYAEHVHLGHLASDTSPDASCLIACAPPPPLLAVGGITQNKHKLIGETARGEHNLLHLREKVGMRMPGAEREAEPSCLEWLELDGDTALTPHSERSDSLRSIRWVQGGISARLARPGAPCRALATQAGHGQSSPPNADQVHASSGRGDRHGPCPTLAAPKASSASFFQVRRTRQRSLGCHTEAVKPEGCRDGWNAVRRAC